MNAALPPLIQRMLQPDFYPHPVQTPVQLLQTHISYVLLTGDFAYKLKKPTQFSLLDFSTLERRAHFCQEELRLNRRLSPELYLAVLPIYLDNKNYNLNPHPEAEIVDYALQMQQFSQNDLFSHLLKTGQLTAAHMQSLAQVVAQFHTTATTHSDIQNNGTPQAISTLDEENYDLARPFIGQSLTQSQWQQTRAFTQRFWLDHQDWLQQRIIQGKIRDCHGDLHLNNVCLYQNHIQIFDCIEFCQEFRNIDVIYDVAFMIMDLQFHNRPDLANIFLNTYIENTGDYEGVRLLPAYLSMRATIRGNVNSITAQNLQLPDHHPPQKSYWQTAKNYFDLAHHYTQPRQGQILMMSGISGSGKSTVARRLACHLNAIHIRSDAVRKHLTGIPLNQLGTHHSIYTPAITRKTYQRLTYLGVTLAKMGWTVIVDAKYDQVWQRAELMNRAKITNLPIQILFCKAPMNILKSRLRNRTDDISDATSDLLLTQQQAFQDFTPEENALIFQMATDQDLDTQVLSFCKHLAKTDNVRLPCGQ